MPLNYVIIISSYVLFFIGTYSAVRVDDGDILARLDSQAGNGDKFTQISQSFKSKWSLDKCSEFKVGGPGAKMHLYHGTHVATFLKNRAQPDGEIQLAPSGPAWFAPDLLPKNKLYIYVPMIRMMCNQADGQQTPLYLKTYYFDHEVTMMQCGDALGFYDNFEMQVALDFCGQGQYAGYALTADGVAREPEWILCNPSADLKFESHKKLGTMTRVGSNTNTAARGFELHGYVSLPVDGGIEYRASCVDGSWQVIA